MSNDLPLEIDVASVSSLQKSDEVFLLLDVRNQDEHETANIDGSVLIPMGELGDRVSELEDHRDSLIVVHCHHGGRSMQVTQALLTQALRGQGFEKVQNMTGGIDQWSQEIDTSVPRY